jgi:mono/diheme cytochrome c family protein
MQRLIFVIFLYLTQIVAAAPWDGSGFDGAGRNSFAYEVKPLFPNVVFPIAMYVQPYSAGEQEKLLVAGDWGLLWSVDDGAALEALPKPVFQLRPYLAVEGIVPRHVRLMSCLFERDMSHLFLFFNAAREDGNWDQVVRFKVAQLEPLKLGEGKELIAWPSSGHDGGDMAWGPEDGMLYISAGDRSAPGDPTNSGQRVDEIRGSILRIDRDGKVPADNPFVGMSNVAPEIWCYGLRNPWRFTFHPERHEIWIGDNGDESWEMVHHAKKGSNAGWSAFEGSHPFRAGNALGGPTLTQTPAVVEHPHTEMRSVIGGIFYRGEALPELRNHYLYACYFTKRLWAFSYKDGVAGKPFVFADAGGDVVSIIEGHDREPIITCRQGSLFTLRAIPEPPASRPWPELLSESRLFANVGEHLLAEGVHGYSINAESWADGATRERWVAMSAAEPMIPADALELGKSWILPQGSVIGQTLTLKGKRVETQLLYFDGTWRGYTYRWNEKGDDANLVAEEGASAEINGQPWRFHSRSECMTCHTQRSNFGLALTTRQVDRKERLEEWIEAGLLQDTPGLKKELGKAMVDPYDTSKDLDARARSYLHINCAHCHRETGLGGRAGFQLLESLSLADTGIVNAKPMVGLLGKAEAKILVPGKPDDSELLGRMMLRGPGQMPLIGSHVGDEKGVTLIREWIEGMK